MNDFHDDESRLRDALHAAVPDGPGPTGRSEALVRRRREQRTRRTAAVGAAAAVVAAVAVGTTMIDGGSSSPQAGGPSVRETGAPPTSPVGPTSGFGPTASGKQTSPGEPERTARAQCPPVVSLSQAQADAMGDVVVPGTATSVWVCPVRFAGARSPVDLPEVAATWQAQALFARTSGVPVADPHRCDNVFPMPRPYVVYWMTAGDRVDQGLVTSMCDDVTVDGRTIASDDFLSALRMTVGAVGSGQGTGPYSGPTQ